MSKFFKTTLAAFLGTFIALFAVMLLLFSIIGSLSSSISSQEGQKVIVAPNSVLKIDFSEMIAEQDADNPFAMISSPGASGKSLGLLKAINSLEIAAQDPSIKFVYMNCDNVNFESLSSLEEFRAALSRFKSSGKAIIAYANNYSAPGYYLASIADKVIMNEYGSANILGLGSNLVFLKDFLDKLGVGIQLIRHGKYKSAGEMYINNNISPANREQNQEMIDAIWDSWVAEIAQSREITVDEFNQLVDNLTLSDAEDMKEHNLVDELMYQNEVEDYICTLTETSKIEDVKMVTLSGYASAKIKQNFKAKDKIAILYANGEIVMGNGSENIASATYAKMISDIRKDSTIKAVLFRVNSPGGSAHAAEIIRNELTLLKEKKPIIVSYGGYAASGGYWISAGCDKIFTNNTTLTGSIGVFSMVPNVEKIMEDKLGINTVAIKSNKHADMMGLGEIVMGNGSENIASATYAKMISDIRKDSTIKAVLFRVNSPGGSAHAAEIIRNELTLLKEKKPIIVSYGGYAASGGYWISAGCDKIFTNNTTLTGSIGVFSMVPNVEKIMEDKLGINTVAIKSNKHADMMGLRRPLDNAEVAYMQNQVEKIYSDFTQIVADGRGMSVERVDELAQGRVWAGVDALENGLADEKGGIIDALNYTANVAGLTDYRIVEYPTPKSQIEILMESLTGSSANVSEPISIFKETYVRMLLNKETGVMARLPYIYLF